MDEKKVTQKKKVIKKNGHSDLSIIQNIYEIRGERVMFDFDLAKRYEVETRVLKQAVRRNMERFPADFIFVLTKQEIDNMVSQFVIPSKKYLGGASPFAFTELGVAMLSSVLNSEKAIKVNIDIMRAFVAVRNYVLNYAEFKQEFKQEIAAINARLDKNDMKFEAIFKLFDEYIKQNKLYKERSRIGFKRNNEDK